ncbi:MAG TPA: Rrf2 family transcriptional regulator [Terriglobia bacterium]|nr:Rrf2 family transcriptional regulator [Terriglobia bacterium]
MKVSSQEEYGLRCLLRIAGEGPAGSLTIPEISQAEGISISYVGKLLRLLRQGGFVTSARGQTGGYTLSRPAQEINVGQVLALLGGRLFESEFCDHHAGVARVCTHSVDCSIRSLWHALQLVVDEILNKTTLKEMLSSEMEMATWVYPMIRFSNEKVREPAVDL